MVAILSAVLPAEAATRTVTLTTDTTPGTPAGTGLGVSGDLRHAMTNATAGDVIEFNCGTPCTITLAGPLPVIGQSYTIDGGSNVIIDGAGAWRAFFVDTGTVTIRNLTIRNVKATGGNGGAGRYSGGGGAGLGAGVFINRATADVTLSKVRFIDAHATGGNGGTSTPTDPFLAPGGGGGLGGNGGDGGASLGTIGGGGGGGGALFGSNGFDGGVVDGGAGATYGGGGGAAYSGGTNGTGGASAYPAGESAGSNGIAGVGGAGGFGGGGGGSSWPNHNGGERGGDAGYGAGGGGSHSIYGAAGTGGGGAGGLNGTKTPTALIPGGIRGGVGRNGGGGGAAAGPAVFVRAGTLTTIASTTTGQAVTAGTGGAATGGTAGDDGQTDATGVYNVAGTVNGSATTGPLASPLPPPGYGLTVATTGSGRVTSSIGNLDCPGACSATVDTFDDTSFTAVTLTAVPGTGMVIGTWSGDCSGSDATQVVTMSAARACTMTFQAAPPPAPTPAPSAPAMPVTPSFVAAPPPPVIATSGNANGGGQISLAASFTDVSALTFTAQQQSGAPLPDWLTFNPGTVSFTYTVPLPGSLPVQGADLANRSTRLVPANTIYAPSVLVARVPVTLTATGAGLTYAVTVQLDFYAPRGNIALAALSMSASGVLGNAAAGRSALSWDGGQVVFETAATNLFPESANSFRDIVRYHGLSGARDRLSQTAIPGGGVANAADGSSTSPAVSADGRYAAFASEAPGITLFPTAGRRQVYRTSLVYPRVPLNQAATPTPDFVSMTADGVAGNGMSDNPALSQDGRYVAFDSTATTLAWNVEGRTQVLRKDMETGTIEVVSNGAGSHPSISWDGRWIAFDNGSQVLLRDMTSTMIRTVAAGTRPRLSARADRIAYVDGAQVVVADLAGNSALVAVAGDQPSLSADGRFVAWRADGQVWVRDVDRGVTALVSQTAAGKAGNGASWNPAISGDGATISFGSAATDIVNGNPAAGQAYIAANPLTLPAKTDYWYMAGPGNGQGWVMERWGNKAYVGGLAYDGQGRSQWLAGPCTFSGLTCSGTLTNGPAFTLATSADGASAGLTVGGAAAQTLTVFPIGGPSRTRYPGLPQTGWWYEPAAGNGVGYFFAVDTQPQADGSAAQIGYLSMLAYDGAGRQVWQSAQAPVSAGFGFTGMLTQYSGGAPFGITTPAGMPSASAVGPVWLVFDGTDRGRITLPDGRVASLQRFRF